MKKFTLTKEELASLLEEHSFITISRLYNIPKSTIIKNAKKFGLSSKYGKIGNIKEGKIIPQTLSANRLVGYDRYKTTIDNNGKIIGRKTRMIGKTELFIKSLPLVEINQDFQSGFTWRQIKDKYNINDNIIYIAFKKNYFLPVPDEIKQRNAYIARKKSKPQSEETRQKQSISRKKYLAEHKEHRWHNKSNHHTSWLCETVKQQLREKGIIFAEEFMPLKEQGRFFSIDIAIPERKIAFEINGRQHYDAKWNLLPYYQKRHDLIESAGWKVHEIKYDKNYMNIVEYIIKELEIVTNNQSSIIVTN